MGILSLSRGVLCATLETSTNEIDARNDNPDWETARLIIMRNADVFLGGFQERPEAESIVELVNPNHSKLFNSTCARVGSREGRHLR
jgi:hypothetical protein